MIVKGEDITFTWAIAPHATPPAASTLDLQITGPDGAVVYYEGTAGSPWFAATYNAPDANNAGSISYAFSAIPLSGVYTLIIGTGTAGNFVILDTSLTMVVDNDDTVTNTIYLP